MLKCALVAYCRLGWLRSLGCAMVAWLSCFHAEKVWPHRHPNPSSRRKGGWTRPRLVLPRSTPVLLPKVAASIPAARSSWAGCSSTPPRTEERRVGTECVSTCRDRWWRIHEQKKKNNEQEGDNR